MQIYEKPPHKKAEAFVLVSQSLGLNEVDGERADSHVELDADGDAVGVGGYPEVHVLTAFERAADLGYRRKLVADLGAERGLESLSAVISDVEIEDLV